MRKTALTLLLASVLCASVAWAEESLEDVLAANYEALGGKEKIQAVKSARFTGKMSGGMMEMPFTIEWKRPGKFRLEFVIQGQTGIQASNGDSFWMYMPIMGKTDPEVMPEEQSKELAHFQHFVDGPFMTAEEVGSTLELMGKEDVEGSEAYRIKRTEDDGDVTYHFLDTEYFLEIKQEAKRTQGEDEIEIEVAVGDYKEIGDLIFAHYMEQKAKGQPAGQVFTFDKIELDVDIDDSRFEMTSVKKAEEGE